MPRLRRSVGAPHQAMRRSISARPPKSTSASAERTTTAAKTRAVCSCALGDQDQVAEPRVGARPLAEDGADHGDGAAILAPLNR